MEGSFEFVSFPYLDKIVILLSLHEKDNITRVIKILNEICKIFESIFSSTISVGIGRICESINEIRSSYKTAQGALDYKPILGNGKTIYIDDLEHDNTIQIQFEEQDEIKLLNAIKISNEKEIRLAVENIFNKMEETVVTLDKYRIYLMEVLTAILKLIQSYNIEINLVFGDEFNFYSNLEEFNSIEEVKKWFIEKSLILNEIIKKERVNSSKLLVEKAKEYIKDNYSDYDLSVEKLCSKIHVSPTYFSTIFKKETDMNFVNYLTNIRLEEAIKLLNTTDDKTYIIASKIGYQEANYFSYVFKKKFGISPSRYRKN